jgi:hypothetical protein
MASLVTGSIVGTLVGNEVLTSTIRNSTASIYSGLSSLMINPNFYFKNVLEELDIEAKLKVITKFIDNIKESTLQEHNKIALNSIYTIIHKIEAEITEINKEIDEHSKKWFNTFRSCNYTTQIENLKKHVKIMDNRFDLYMKIVF